MKAKWYILIFITFTISCRQENDRIKSFNNSLPKTDRKVLESWVDFYEDIIKENYPSSSIKVLLDDILNNRTSKWKYDRKDLCRLLVEFRESTLDFKTERLKYDTVYLGYSKHTKNPTNTMVITVTQENDTSEHIEILHGDNSWRAQVEKVKSEGYQKLINESSFVEALNHQKNPTEIDEYIEAKEIRGHLNYKYMAASLKKDSSINYEDYFIKRIIVIEIIHNHMKQEHGC